LWVNRRSVFNIAAYSKSLNAAQRNYPATIKAGGPWACLWFVEGQVLFVGAVCALTIWPLHMLTCRELNDMMRE
jgi:hypothetical protein